MLPLLSVSLLELSEAGEIVLETLGLLSADLLVAEVESSVREGISSVIDFSFLLSLFFLRGTFRTGEPGRSTQTHCNFCLLFSHAEAL